MRKSIFDIEIRVDIDYEFERLKDILFEKNSLYYNRTDYSLYGFLNQEVFPIWKYKGMFVDFNDFLERLKINLSLNTCQEEKFLYLLELLVNLWKVAESKLDPSYEKYFSKRVIGYMRINLPLIIENMNYQIIEEHDRYKLVKRDSDVDSVLDIVPEDYAKLLLDYNDIRNNTIDAKRSILKELDLYIENTKKTYQEVDKDTYNTIQFIVNNMGINHPLKKEPYLSMNEVELIEWYDKCFKLMIHLIREKEVNEINKERKQLTNE